MAKMSKGRVALYPNLEAELTRHGYTRADVAEAGGFYITTASDKLTKKDRLTIAEGKLIRDKLFPGMDIEYLFATETDKAAAVRRDA